MNMRTIVKPAFTVIGREGSTREGAGFVQRLWADANARFEEIAPLAKRNEDGSFAGFWGAMSDFSRAFLPWQNDFSEGLYLAGAECIDGAEAPAGWTKWIVPGFEYLRVEAEGPDTFADAVQVLHDNGIALAGAVQDFTCPATGKDYLCFPIRRL